MAERSSARIWCLQLAVQSFFIISGFYMALVLHEKYGPGLTRVFYFNRFLRLFPVYAAVLAGVFVLQFFFSAHFIGRPEPGEPAAELPASAMRVRQVPDNPVAQWRRDGPRLQAGTIAYLVITNLTTIGQESLEFFSVDPETGSVSRAPPSASRAPAVSYMLIPQAWSIGVELLFYLVAPYIVRRGVPVLVSLIVGSLALRVILLRLGFSGNPWNDRIFPLELAFFLAGAVGFKAYRRYKPFIESHRGLAIGLWVWTLGLIVGFQFIPVPMGIKRVLLFGSVAVGIPFLFGLTRRNRLDRYIGEMSYPFYLTHMIVLMGLAGSHVDSPLLAAGLTLVVSMALFHGIDGPIDRVRQFYAQRKKAEATRGAPVPPEKITA